MGRAPCCDKASVKKGHWSPEEDKQLKEFIEKHGRDGNWNTLPRKAGTIVCIYVRVYSAFETLLIGLKLTAGAGLNRCGKSCRLRWLNYLRPNVKHGSFSDDEDMIIITLYAAIGSRSVKFLHGNLVSALTMEPKIQQVYVQVVRHSKPSPRQN